MRQGRDCSILKEDNKIIGVNLGADYCAEHEWGIKGIKSKLGIDSGEKDVDFSWWEKVKQKFLIGNIKPLFGIEKRKITKGSDRLLKLEFEVSSTSNDRIHPNNKKIKVYGLVLASTYDKIDNFKHYGDKLFWNSEKDEIRGFWGEDRFLIILKEESQIDELMEAFKINDISIWLGGGGPFKNSGLVISITSKLPADLIEEMYETDVDYYELQCEAVRTGIYDTLEKAGKKFMALSPRWKDKNKREVTFWLNPYDQQNNNYGWYELKDLEDWAEDRGKIPMKKEKV